MTPNNKEEGTEKAASATVNGNIATKIGAAHCASSIHLNLPVKKVSFILYMKFSIISI